MVYAFWNNKGGTGKTSLAFQGICQFAHSNPEKSVLAIDLCPQANLSELFLGGLVGGGGANLQALHGRNVRGSIGGYFDIRLRSPFLFPASINPKDFVVKPASFNNYIPTNIDLIAGDGLVELQAGSITNIASNLNAAVANPWAEVMDWLNQLLVAFNGNSYDYVFIDTNPSFAIYTQIAIAAAGRLIVPVMADDSSRRAFLNVLALVYGLGIPATVTPAVLFNNAMAAARKPLPKIHLIIKNSLTQYMGEATAYGAVLRNIIGDVASALTTSSSAFTFNNVANGVLDVSDFHSTGVVSFANGCPFFNLKQGKYVVSGQDIQLNKDYIKNYKDNIVLLANKLL